MSAPVADVELVLFEAGGRRWAADAWDVCRIDRRRDGAPSAPLVPAVAGDRALVVSGPDGEVEVPIERLLGFERVSARALRPLPGWARGLALPAVVGAWLAPSDIVLLIDLQCLVKVSGAQRRSEA